MKSNFDFLRDGFEEQYNFAVEAEQNVEQKPRTSLFYARLALEQLIKWVYQADSSLPEVDLQKSTLESLMYHDDFKLLLAATPDMISRITAIRKSGNQATHSKAAMHIRYAHTSIQNLYEFSKWVYYYYVDNSVALPFKFDTTLIPSGNGESESNSSVKALQSNIEQIKAESDKSLNLKDEELKRLREEIARIKAENNSREVAPFVTDSATEAETRRALIDVMLREMGWDVDASNATEYEVDGMPNETGKGYVDYVLWGDDGLPLAVVEAKRTMRNPKEGERQAWLYAECLKAKFGRMPLIFYTNGYTTWLWDAEMYPPRKVAGFYTKDELEWAIQKRGKAPLSEYRIKPEITDRPYQERAIKRVAETFTDCHRRALLVMATGTGKTRTAISIVDMLIKQGWVRKALFLADRVALVSQAKTNFVKLLPDLSCINIATEKEDIDKFKMVFSTYPTMMNKIDSERKGDRIVYTPAHFDLVIIDEAHRSVYQKYQAIFDYFDAPLIGLTATPKSEVDKNTYELFKLENHNPTDFYELDTAVAEGYLVPPKRVDVTTQILRDGIKYSELSEADKARYEEDFANEITGEIEEEEISSNEINKRIFNKDTVDLVINDLMTRGLKIEGGDKLGKSVIFAKNHKHAEYIKERFDELYPRLKGGYMQIVHNKVEHAQNIIDSFSDPMKEPQIAVSVDMLDTGIDVPEILNLVFFKVVRSSSKFWQMIGRGTRLCPAIFGIPENEDDKSKDKKEFLIFDHCGNFDFFEYNPDGFETKMPKSVSQRILETQILLSMALSSDYADSGDSVLSEYKTTLLDAIHLSITSLDRKSFVVKQKLEVVDRYSVRGRLDTLSNADSAELFELLTPMAVPMDKDEDARNFDLMMLRFMLAITDGNEPADKYIDKLTNIGKSLLKKSTLPIIKQREETLRQIVSPHFWSNDVTVVSLEKVRTEIRELIKLIEKDKRKIVYTDIKDELIHISDEPKEVLTTYTSSESYKQRVETYVRDNQDYMVIQKIKRNIPITHRDIEMLESILFDGNERGTKEDFVRNYGDKPLGHFIRSIVGLDSRAASDAFSEFLQAGNLTANQNQFITTIIKFLTTDGIIDPGMLFEDPFTRIDTDGVFGVFGEVNTQKIIHIIEQINQNAAA